MEVTANGVRLHFERRGSGPPLVFFNGSGATLETSAPLITPFTERFDVVAHDQRGLGRSSSPPGDWSMADYASDAAALLDQVGWSACRVVGVSFGGMVAQEFAVTWPERVQRLALACTSPGGPDLASYPLHELAQRPLDEQVEIGMRILDSRFTDEWLSEHPADRGLADLMSSRRGAPKSDEQKRGEEGQLHARSTHDVRDRLSRITCPTLVAAGRYDGIAPPANSEYIAAHIPNAELRMYEGGHLFFLQDGQALPDILTFLSGDDGD
jgi:pimeloyl-ACP methyl ester carboxylesterase